MFAEINERDPLEKYGRTALLTDTAALTTDNRQRTTIRSDAIDDDNGKAKLRMALV